MDVVRLDEVLEPVFWECVNKDIPHYYFFAFDWKYNREATEILLALEGNQVLGMMLVYRQRIVQLRGSLDAVKALLQRLDLEKVELQALPEHKEVVLKKYGHVLKQSHDMMLMTVRRGEEKPQLRHSVVTLDVSDAEQIVDIMVKADREFWGEMTRQNIVEGMERGVNWFGVRVDGDIVSVGSSRLTEWTGHIGVVATCEAYRNRGYATSVVSELVRRILGKLSLAMIFVLADNAPAVRAYSKVGFKPYRLYFFMRGEKR